MNAPAVVIRLVSSLKRHIPAAATFGVLAACLLSVGALEADPLEARRTSAQAYCEENAWDLPNCESPDPATEAATHDRPTIVSVDWSEIAIYLDADDTIERERAEAGWSGDDFPEARPRKLAAAY